MWNKWDLRGVEMSLEAWKPIKYFKQGGMKDAY